MPEPEPDARRPATGPEGTTESRSTKEYLGHAVQSVGKALSALNAAQALRKAAGESQTNPMDEAYFWTVDALFQGVAAFVCAVDEASAAHQLIEDPHSHKLFEPVLIRRELILAGQFLAAFELLMGSVVGQLRASFYTGETPPAERAEKEREYAAAVLSLDKSSLWASCLWLKNQGVLADDDIARIDRIRRHRNNIAHRLPALLFTKTWFVPVDEFRGIAELVSKVDMWWLAQTSTRQPRSGSMVLLEYMLEAVTRVDLGPESPLRPAGPTGPTPGRQEPTADEAPGDS